MCAASVGKTQRDIPPEVVGLRTQQPKYQLDRRAMGGGGELNECCARFKVTTLVIILLEIAMLILFGFFVRYDELGMPIYPKTQHATTHNPNSSDASTSSMSMPITSTYHPSNPVASTVPTISGSPSTPTPPATNTSGEQTTNASFSPTLTTLPLVQDNSSGAPSTPATTPDEMLLMEEKEHAKESVYYVNTYYAPFQDIHTMMFIGFGFLMTFLKRYGFSSIGFNFLLAAFVLQWATLTNGWILHYTEFKVARTIPVNLETLINADFAAAAILISFGAVLGKLSILQLMVMVVIEVVAYQANELFVFKFLQATDIGDSMVVHTFGAYFGLAVAWVNYKKEVEEADEKEGSVYHSDLFSIIGTIFLWLFWPSFNSGTAYDEGRLRAIINTYYALAASTVVAFAISALLQKEKFNMVHIQNSTLAGGVAIGTMADMIIQPWGAILVGGVAGVVSVLGYRYLTPFLSKRLRLHDTCGVNNLHGMPGLISGIGSILAAGLATEELYGNGRDKIFPAQPPRTPSELAGYQCAATFVSLFMGLVCGAITGMILRIPMWNPPTPDEIFDDDQTWLLPSEEYDVSAVGKVEIRRGDYTNTIEMPGIRNHKDQSEQ